MKKRGPIIHGVLLAVGLVFAYQTWTREEKPDRNIGDEDVWSVSQDAITKISYSTKDRTVELERRGQGAESYFWGKDSRTIKKPRPPRPRPQDGDAGATAPAVPDEPETELKVREFAVGDKGEELVENLAELKALRELGALDDDRRKEYGLDESTDSISVVVAGKSRTLVVGGNVPGSGGGRYVLDPDSDRAYAVAGAVINNLIAGEAGLRLRTPHLYGDEEVGKAVVTAGGKTRNLVRITVEEENKKNKTWADAATPDKPDQTMANFLENIKKLNPSQYEPEIDPASLELLTKVVYQTEGGKELGWLELYEQAPEPAPAPTPAAPGAPAGGAAGQGSAKPAPGQTDGNKPTTGAVPGAMPAAEPGKDATTEPAAADAHGADPHGHDDHAGESKPEPPKPAPKAAYYIRSEATRTYAKVSDSIATRIKEDIAQILAE